MIQIFYVILDFLLYGFYTLFGWDNLVVNLYTIFFKNGVTLSD